MTKQHHVTEIPRWTASPSHESITAILAHSLRFIHYNVLPFLRILKLSIILSLLRYKYVNFEVQCRKVGVTVLAP